MDEVAFKYDGETNLSVGWLVDPMISETILLYGISLAKGALLE